MEKKSMEQQAGNKRKRQARGLAEENICRPPFPSNSEHGSSVASSGRARSSDLQRANSGSQSGAQRRPLEEVTDVDNMVSVGMVRSSLTV